MFIEGLERVDEAGQELTWLNYINAMESAPVDIPMGGAINLTNGNRVGIEDLSLSRYDMTTAQLAVYSPLTSLTDIMVAVPADKKK